MSVAELSIGPEDPRWAEPAALVAALDAYCASLYAEEENHLLSLDDLAAPDVIFLVVREAGRAVGCGAVRLDPSGYGEIKRMMVAPQARGRGIGRMILAELERRAIALGMDRLLLETGIRQPEALALYESAGFGAIGPFGGYSENGVSVFMEKKLSALTAEMEK